MATKKNDGKKIEDLVGKVLRELRDEGKSLCPRLYDSKSAGGFLPPVPGDFMGMLLKRPVLIECKSSDRFNSFSDCRLKDFIEPVQYANHKIWLKQGGVSLFIFHAVMTDTVEIWGGGPVLKSYSESTLLSPRVPAAACGLVKTDLRKHLIWVMKTFCKGED